MRTLYHVWLSPFCRKIRIALAEKKLPFEMHTVNLRERPADFVALNPACEVPVLVEDDGAVVADSVAIVEYLEEKYPEPALLHGDARGRAEIRRLMGWFDGKFNREVTEGLVGERILKRLLRLGEPDSRAIRAAKKNIAAHLDYIDWLADRRRWLAGDQFSYADIAAAAHLSALDYIGEVPWDEHEPCKVWYARVKSRPSFRPILGDHVPGEPPPRHYADLDF
jgi:glutathione S-transferase